MPNFTVDQANELIRDAIENNTKHDGYQRTVDLRTDYLTVITGNGYPRFLSRFIQRESPEEFQQRLDLTYQNLSSTANPLLKKVSQISRIQDIKKGINFNSTSERDQRDLLDVLNDFGGEGSSKRQSLDDYLTDNYDQLSQYDPNAFIVLDFLPFNAARGERARPYGILFTSPNVYNFRYTRGVLDYLLVVVTVTYKDPDKLTRTATDYICFGGPFTIRYYEQGNGRLDLPVNYEEYKSPADTVYRVATFAPGIDEVPAVRIGDLQDIETGGTTCVSRILHAAMDQFKELINLKSQYDIIRFKHSFPRMFERAPLCQGEPGPDGYHAPCDNGINKVTGQTCKACGGSGFETHRTEQDTVRMPIKGDEAVDELFDMSRLIFVQKPELETIKTYKEIIDSKQREINVTVYSSDQQIQVQGQTPSKTATEYVVSREDQNNTLLPIADHKSFCYKSLVRCMTKLMNISGEVDPAFEFPRDLKLTSADDIMSDIAEKVGRVPATILEQKYDDYHQKVYESDPVALAWYFFKKAHISFLLTPREDFEWYVSSGYVTDNDRTRLIYCENIIADLRMTVPNILDLPYDVQEQKINEAVDRILADLPQPMNLSDGIRKLNSLDQQQEQQTA